MKRITKFSLFALAGILGTGAAFAQAHSVQANVPFDFTVGSRHLPAGTYRLNSLRDDLVEVENRETRAAVLSLVASDSQQPSKGAQLVFNKYGDQYFLSEVLGGPGAINASLPVAKLEEGVRHQKTLAQNRSQVSVAAEGY
jgi:hypothetical protein